MSKIFIVMMVIILISTFGYLYFGSMEKTLQIQGKERSYLLHIPRGYHKDKQYPLVIMLHGYSDHPRLMEFYTGMSQKADKEKFIVIYPKGTNNSIDKKLSWNAGFCCGGAKAEYVDDVAFIDRLLYEIKTTYSINSKKVYIVGFSNGAMLAHKLGVEMASQLTAIAAISGTVGGESIALQQSTTPLRVFIMHGTNDKVIPFEGGENRDGDTYQSVKNGVDYWKSNKSEVVLYIVEDGGHIWFGGKQEFFTNIIKPSVSATDKIWEFFQQSK